MKKNSIIKNIMLMKFKDILVTVNYMERNQNVYNIKVHNTNNFKTNYKDKL